MLESQMGQRIAGMITVGFMGGIMAFVWQNASAGRGFNEWAAFMAPALLVFGFALMLFPINLAAHRAKWRTSRPTKLHHFPRVWQILFVVSVFAGIGNWFALHKLTP